MQLPLTVPTSTSTFAHRALAALRRVTFYWKTQPSNDMSYSEGPLALSRSTSLSGPSGSTEPHRAAQGGGEEGPTTRTHSGEIAVVDAVTSRPSRSSTTPVCLICLENLSADDFASGRAISLGCQCRGELALRHKDCAEKWARVKDDGRGGIPVCELCKQPARNLKPLPARPRSRRPFSSPSLGGQGGDASSYGDGLYSLADFAPSTADLAFDCIRVTWVAMIVSILFFEASLGSALWTGVIAGFAYCVMVRAMYRQHFAAMRAHAERESSRWQEAEMDVEGEEGGRQIPVVAGIV